MKKDITNMNDIMQLVDTFYERVRKDQLLKNIFENQIQDRWPAHLEKMHRFWQTVLLEEHTYYGSPFPPHVKLSVGAEHFEQWIRLFRETVDDLFAGDNAAKAKWQGKRMAEMFHSKIEYYRGNSIRPIL
jgi:hemoglobin